MNLFTSLGTTHRLTTNAFSGNLILREPYYSCPDYRYPDRCRPPIYLVIDLLTWSPSFISLCIDTALQETLRYAITWYQSFSFYLYSDRAHKKEGRSSYSCLLILIGLRNGAEWLEFPSFKPSLHHSPRDANEAKEALVEAKPNGPESTPIRCHSSRAQSQVRPDQKRKDRSRSLAPRPSGRFQFYK